MFDIGFWEILLILVLALVVLGPERLPQAARSVGYWVGKARRYIEGVKEQVGSEFDTTEFKRLLHNQEVQIKELQNKLSDAGDSISDAYTNELDEVDEPDAHHYHEADDTEYEILEEDDDEIISDHPAEEITEQKSIEKSQQSLSPEKTE